MQGEKVVHLEKKIDTGFTSSNAKLYLMVLDADKTDKQKEKQTLYLKEES